MVLFCYFQETPTGDGASSVKEEKMKKAVKRKVALLMAYSGVGYYGMQRYNYHKLVGIKSCLLHVVYELEQKLCIHFVLENCDKIMHPPLRFMFVQCTLLLG